MSQVEQAEAGDSGDPLKALLDEFRGVTNERAYELAFHKRLMRPDPSRPGHFLGNTQREGFLQYLLPIVEELRAPFKPKDDSNETVINLFGNLLSFGPPRSHNYGLPMLQVFDFGAGAGDIVDLALKVFPWTVINLEEPNPILLSKYKAKLLNYPQLKLGIAYSGPIQDYYKPDAAAPRPEEQQDLILGIHMIYHLTHLHDPEIDPDRDLIEAVSFMYSLLKSNGVLFLAVADQRISTSGQASRYYYQKKGLDAALENHRKIADSRFRLLQEKQIAEHLNERFKESVAQIESYEDESYVYGDSKEDIVAICTTAETSESNDQPFDLEKLEIFHEFVETFPNKIDLMRETRDIPQKGMMRSNQQQIITVIRRGAR